MSQGIKFERISSSDRDGTLSVDSHLRLPLDALLTAGIDKEVDNRLLDALFTADIAKEVDNRRCSNANHISSIV